MLDTLSYMCYGNENVEESSPDGGRLFVMIGDKEHVAHLVRQPQAQLQTP